MTSSKNLIKKARTHCTLGKLLKRLYACNDFIVDFNSPIIRSIRKKGRNMKHYFISLKFTVHTVQTSAVI